MIRPISISSWKLSLLAAAFIVAVNNTVLFSSLFGSLDLQSFTGITFFLFITALMVFVLGALFLTIGVGPLLKIVVAFCLITSACLGYFVNDMGVVFDGEMFANISDTISERNLGEAQELASTPLLLHVLLFGIVPSVLLFFVRIKPQKALFELRDRAIAMLAGAVVVGILGFSDFRYITYYAVEHRDLRFKVTPIYPMVSAVRKVRDSLHEEPPFQTLAADAKQNQSGKRRTVGILVVGETARSDHFSLNGYERITNPYLSEEKDLLFLNARSCGTSTAFSVPCMFFLRGHEAYSPDIASAESNVLDALTTAGVKAVWIDNNSTCKHVCDRIENENMRVQADGSVQHDGEYDIELVKATERYLDSDGADLLIVLHMMGSHGPAYSHRYPPEFAKFTPYCEKLSPTECTVEEVANAYDNSIAYTDFILGQLIARLKQHADEFDSFLFYASDHGESLGENGVYLHGMPYAMAPQAQTEVPLILWMSPEYVARTGLGAQAVAVNAEQPRTHDYIPHTLLRLFDVETALYEPDRDLFVNGEAETSRISVTQKPGG
jgi:lipid A ethanolaminephosphotransferase